MREADSALEHSKHAFLHLRAEERCDCQLSQEAFQGQEILNVTGIRREESAGRRKADVAKADPRLAQRGAQGFTWNPVIEWKIDEVKAAIARRGLELHEAYTRYGMTRVSCAFCIMSSAADLKASTTCIDNQDIYRTMVELETSSTFAFQSNNWLGDVAPHLLGSELADRFQAAKRAAQLREIAEKKSPQLGTKGLAHSPADDGRGEAAG